MVDILFPYGAVGIQMKTFKVASAAIHMGTPVELNAADAVQVSDSNLDCIGTIMPDERYEGENGTTLVAIGDLVNVALKGPVLDLVCGTTVSVGDIAMLTTGGAINIGYESGTTAADLKYGIVFEAGTIGNRANVMRL